MDWFKRVFLGYGDPYTLHLSLPTLMPPLLLQPAIGWHKLVKENIYKYSMIELVQSVLQSVPWGYRSTPRVEVNVKGVLK